MEEREGLIGAPEDVLAEAISDQEEFCPWCGLTRRELYAEGKMGCAKCYDTFAAEAMRALKEIHGEDEHVGKT